jgi:hypothetical protein
VSSLFESGQVVDLIILWLVLETGWALRGGHARARADIAWNAASGICLLVALRAALTEWSWLVIAAALTGAGAMHACALFSRGIRMVSTPGGR